MDNEILQKKEAEKKQAFENLLFFKEVLDKNKIDFILDGGTLLGAYRDKDFCEDDHNDVDLTTIGNQERILDILEDAGILGFSLYHYWKRNDSAKNTTAQISVIKDGLKIDLMFKETKNKKAWWTVFGVNNKTTYKAVPGHFYMSLKEIDFKGTKFLIPADTEGYLKLRYGDWKIPVHRRDFSCFTSDKVIVENYGKI